MTHRRFITFLWLIVAVLVGALLLPLLMERDQNDPDTIALFIFAIAVLGFAGYKIIADWRASVTDDEPSEPASQIAREVLKAGMPDTAPPEPSDAAGLQDKLTSVFERVPLEQQIGEFAAAGLPMLAERTLEDLIKYDSRESFQAYPYANLLRAYADYVGHEGFRFTREGWTWELKSFGEPPDYTGALRHLERITGQSVFTTLTDETGTNDPHIAYAIQGGEVRKQAINTRLAQEFGFDEGYHWADAAAIAEILIRVEGTINDGRRFWSNEGDDSELVFFISDKTAAALNKLHSGLLLLMYNPDIEDRSEAAED